MTLEERIVELETRLAFQDDAQHQLDQALLEQQKRIAALEQKLERLTRDLHTLQDSAPSLPPELEPPPPHY